MSLPHSEACERNKKPILEVIQDIFQTGTVLELGTGTAQHAEFFSQNLDVQWQTSDQAHYLPGIMRRKKENSCSYLNPFELKVCAQKKLEQQIPWRFEGLFSANTLHIMDEEDFFRFPKEVGGLLKSSADLVLYGPFIFSDQELSPSNQKFDQDLKSRNPKSGLRKFDDLMAGLKDFEIAKITPMPANNHLLHFKKNS